MKTTRPSRIALLGIGIALTSLLGSGTASAAVTPTAASGSVAAVSGSSMEVQNQQTGQTTVSWTRSTGFSKTVTMSAKRVAVGDCVTVTGSTSKGKLVARTVMVTSPPKSGTCTTGVGAGRAGGGFGGFAGGSPPNGASLPNGSKAPNGGKPPSGSAPGGAGRFSFASGKVTSISSSKMVVKGISSSGFTRPATTKKGSAAPKAPKATSVEVGLAQKTTFTRTRSTTARSLAVGDCVTAVGSSDSTGAVKATTVQITSTGGKSCTSGFGRGAVNG